MTDSIKVQIPIIELKKPAICALGACGKEIPEGLAIDFGKGKYTHYGNPCRSGYLRELLSQETPHGKIIAPEPVSIKYV